jgi:hypothetical protein
MQILCKSNDTYITVCEPVSTEIFVFICHGQFGTLSRKFSNLGWRAPVNFKFWGGGTCRLPCCTDCLSRQLQSFASFHVRLHSMLSWSWCREGGRGETRERKRQKEKERDRKEGKERGREKEKERDRKEGKERGREKEKEKDRKEGKERGREKERKKEGGRKAERKEEGD